jgi:DNA repair protein RadB
MPLKAYIAKEDSYRLPLGCLIDDLLGGGLESKIITQLYGPAATGKTNICLLATINCVRRGKKAVFIDTEAGRSLERLKQLAKEDFEVVLENTIFLEPKTFEEQDYIIDHLDEILSDKFGLIVLDSAVSLYRLHMDDENAAMTNKQFSKQLSKLIEFARRYNLPVLITNQVYSSFDDGFEKPIGGSIVKYRSKVIIELREDGKKRLAILRRHRSMPENLSAKFLITSGGIRAAK